MSSKFKNLYLKYDLDRIKTLHFIHMFLLFLSFYLEIANGIHGLGVFFKVLIFLVFYRYFYKTARDLYYSYWTFVFLINIYVLYALGQNLVLYNVPALIYVHLLFLLFLWVQMYLISSPVFYPRISWWEYDFRYRDDLKIKVYFGDLELPGRLTDLRRKAGSLVMFHQFNEGDVLNIRFTDVLKEFTFKVEIVSRREYSIGRGYNYGVRFILESKTTLSDYNQLYSYWNEDRKKKRLKKFKTIQFKK